MEVTKWTKLKSEVFGKTTKAQLVSSKNVTVCKFCFKEQKKLPLHAHINEQITFVLKGKLKITMDKKARVMAAGDIVVIPSNKNHLIDIFEVPFESIDVFSPVRKDFLKQLETKTIKR